MSQSISHSPIGVWIEDKLFIADCCGFCGKTIVFDPKSVHSARSFGVGPKKAICPSCVAEWNKIHRTDKGLEPIPFRAEAYPEHLQPEYVYDLDTGLGI